MKKFKKLAPFYLFMALTAACSVPSDEEVSIKPTDNMFVYDERNASKRVEGGGRSRFIDESVAEEQLKAYQEFMNKEVFVKVTNGQGISVMKAVKLRQVMFPGWKENCETCTDKTNSSFSIPMDKIRELAAVEQAEYLMMTPSLKDNVISPIFTILDANGDKIKPKGTIKGRVGESNSYLLDELKLCPPPKCY